MSDARSFSQLQTEPKALSWHRGDIEQQMFFNGGRFTQVNSLLSFLLATVITISFYAAIVPLRDTWIRSKFVGQGVIPCAIVFFTAWCLAILFLKWQKLRLQQRCLALQIIPADPDFVLSPRNMDDVLARMQDLVDDPRQFLLFNRISIALSNLRNLGRVTDVDEILRTQGDSDESVSESSWVLLAGFLWAIPILGFIGTVLGLSIAIGEFGSVMSASGQADALLPALRKVTAGLGVAFDTTLEALVAALVIQLLITFLRKAEQQFLDQCSEYCSRHIVNRLRILPFQDSPEAAQQ